MKKVQCFGDAGAKRIIWNTIIWLVGWLNHHCVLVNGLLNVHSHDQIVAYDSSSWRVILSLNITTPAYDPTGPICKQGKHISY